MATGSHFGIESRQQPLNARGRTVNCPASSI